LLLLGRGTIRMRWKGRWRDWETLYTMVEEFGRIKRITKRRHTSLSSMGMAELITLKGDEMEQTISV
jgi:hypothetical protein